MPRTLGSRRREEPWGFTTDLATKNLLAQLGAPARTTGADHAEAALRFFMTSNITSQGDVVLPGQQRTGGFALSLMAELGTPIRNRFGLRPATTDDGKPGPFQLAAGDGQRLLSGVRYLNLHHHLPHLERLDAAEAALEVLLRQVVSLDAPPHPVMPPGSLFDSVLQARPEAGLGRLIVCDATLWTSNNGWLDGLDKLWKNVLAD